MKILFLTHYFFPHIGGVEKHTLEVARILGQRGNDVTVLTEKYKPNLKDEEVVDGVKVKRFSYIHSKFLGLISIWLWIWKNRSIVNSSELVHCHDVFIWYLPFRFIFSGKKVFTTLHGWEGFWPIPLINIFQKRIAARLSRGTIAVGGYIEKFYGLKAHKILYGGTLEYKDLKLNEKVANSVVFLGRLEKDTGVLEFLKRLDHFKYRNVVFIGDGPLRNVCKKYGRVLGFRDPAPYLRKSEYCVPGGYLSYIEAKQFGCKILTYSDSPLKKEYWREVGRVKKFPSWEGVADEYLDLWKN